ncbi:MAG: FecR family protein [Calditerrivibrio sp.]|nr:FecR family protein [Calditerrivibrio sp.]MCA1932660.1 FecR family protein [Calditerrivibrio sp.]MCA1980266.1 FecR family protein [Calditerrivibrio sp.]
MGRLLSIVFFLISFSVFAYSLELAGQIEKFDGKVIVYKSGSIKGSPAKKGFELHKGDSVRTFSKSNAYIKFVDDSKMVLTENSTMYIKEIKMVNLKVGKVVSEIQKQENKEGVKIATKSAIIGVKGTRFLVNVDKDGVDVVLKEGKINVQSVKGEFKSYLKEQEEDFNKFVEETKKDYDEYKKKMEEEFIEFVKEFTLEGEMAVSIKRNEVKKLKDTSEFDDEFELIKNF